MKFEKNNEYKLKLSTLWISKEELSSILNNLTESLKKEYEEVSLYNMLNIIEREQLGFDFERGRVFYFLISTYDNVCIAGEDTREIYEELDAIEINIKDISR